MRLPAYGRQLLVARNAGRHPHFVHVFYGPRIPRPAGGAIARLAVLADDYRPGLYDWRVCAGLIAAVIDWCPPGVGSVSALLSMLDELDASAVGAELRTARALSAPSGSRWCAHASEPFPLNGCMRSDIAYWTSQPPAPIA